MHVIITGGAGFIGSQTAEALLKRGDTVSVIDAFDFGYDPKHKEHNISLLSNLMDLDCIVETYEIELSYNKCSPIKHLMSLFISLLEPVSDLLYLNQTPIQTSTSQVPYASWKPCVSSVVIAWYLPLLLQFTVLEYKVLSEKQTTSTHQPLHMQLPNVLVNSSVPTTITCTTCSVPATIFHSIRTSSTSGNGNPFVC